jgi:uncharacterized protein
MGKAKDVDEYIANASGEAQSKLREVRAIIKGTIGKAEESINWDFPFYKYHGTLAHFAEYKHHVALGFGSDIKDSDRKALEKNGYATGQKRIQIRFDQKVPTTEIKQILKEQAKMNEAKKE